jgi:UrcA family protein
MKTSLLSALVLGAALTSATAAAAQPATRTVSEQVSYSDLDLSNGQGVRTFDRRIDAAIRRLCGTGPTTSLAAHVERRQCRQEARSSVQPQRAFAIAAAQGHGGATRVAALGQ